MLGKAQAPHAVAKNGAIETFRTLPSGASLRQVLLRSGAPHTTSMGKAETRGQETEADRAERAFLTQRERPTPGLTRAVRTVDLYSGCGGLSLGVEEACRAVGRRFKAVAAFDTDKDARETYAANFPGTTTWSADVSELFSGAHGSRLTASERRVHGPGDRSPSRSGPSKRANDRSRVHVAGSKLETDEPERPVISDGPAPVATARASFGFDSL